jgi:hypothetical protein
LLDARDAFDGESTLPGFRLDLADVLPDAHIT